MPDADATRKRAKPPLSSKKAIALPRHRGTIPTLLSFIFRLENGQCLQIAEQTAKIFLPDEAIKSPNSSIKRAPKYTRRQYVRNSFDHRGSSVHRRCLVDAARSAKGRGHARRNGKSESTLARCNSAPDYLLSGRNGAYLQLWWLAQRRLISPDSCRAFRFQICRLIRR